MERDGLVLDMPEAMYHGEGEFGEFRTAEFSSSAAKKIMESAAHYEWEYLRTDKPVKKPSKALLLGHALHAAVLGVGSNAVEVPKEHLTDSGLVATRKSAAEWIAQQEAAGLIPLHPNDYADVQYMKESVLAHPDAGPAIELGGAPEVSMFGTDPRTGIRCRGRFDFMPTDHPIAIDLKTGESASLRGFTRAIDTWKYDIQHGHYMDLAEWLDLGVTDMVFVVVEKTPPYSTNVIQLDRDWQDMGRARAAEARARLQRGRETGEWPAYPPGVKIASPPPWVVSQFQDEIREDLEMRS